MISIAIENESCIRCSKCVKVCPVYIFTQEKKGDTIGLRNVKNCIECGHCVDACPTSSVLHNKFPADKVHNLKRDILPQPEQLLELLRARRSNRAFTNKEVPQELLDQIVEAAYLAPTAGNGQELSFTLVTDPDMLQKIVDFTIETYEAAIKKLSNPFLKPLINLTAPSAKAALPKLKGVVKTHHRGVDIILRNAKAILFIHTPASSTFGRQDANLAYQNGSLMAESLGVSQFYTGFICSAADLDKSGKLAKMLQIDGKIHAGMALGMPAFKFPKYSDRIPLRLNKI